MFILGIYIPKANLIHDINFPNPKYNPYSIAIRQQEISIMKAIGAAEMFIQMPFLVEAFVIYIFGTTIPLVMFYALYKKVMIYVEQKFVSPGGMLDFINEKEVFEKLIPAAVCMRFGISIFGSIFT